MDWEEIKLFLRKYSEGNYSEADHDRFINWLDSASMQEIEQVAEEYQAIAGHDLSPDGKPPARIVGLIEAALDRWDAASLSPRSAKSKVVPFRKIVRVAAAAVIGVLIAGSLTYWLLDGQSSERTKEKLVAPVIQGIQAPQSTKAMITLGNGQVIYLDSAGKGVLTKQGNVNIIKTAAGEVVYKSSAEQEKTDRLVYNTLYNPRGSKVVSLTLGDGTKVWLNAASSLRYPVAFEGNERRIEITGEAYFEVARNVNKKFIVNAGGVITEVLGTHFNVNAYQDEGRTVVTLLEGAVRIKDSGSSVVIQPGQQAVAAHGLRVVNHADVVSAVAWKNGEFVMKGADVGSIMRQISRWYNVDVIYEGGIPEVSISGEVSRSLSLSQILQVLKYSGIHVELNGDKVIVAP